jgi:hypothetical protein
MNSKHFFIVLMTGIMVCAVTRASAEVKLKTDSEDISLGITGDAGLQVGQAVNYFYKDLNEYHHQWIQQSLLHVGIDALYNENLRIKVGIEGRLWFSLPDQSGKTTGQAYALYDKTFTYSLYEACGTYLFDNLFNSPLSFSITAGLFRYKYNPDVRNLGEYLFRSLAYPAVLINYFDQTDTRLAGVKFSADLPLAEDFLKLHGDLMLTFETENYPFFDGTPSFIGNCGIGNFLDVGLGVALYHLFPVNDSLTRPQTDPRNLYIKNGNAYFYTYGGTKLMARISFDPKKFIPPIELFGLELFGPEDLKLYSEAAILGLENYPANDSVNSPQQNKGNLWGYDTLSHKIPVTMGFNWPTYPLLSYTIAPGIAAYFVNKEKVNLSTLLFSGGGIGLGAGLWYLEKYFGKIFRLDVLNLEAEWYGCSYPMNLANAVRLGGQYAYPIPAEYNKPLSWYTSDNWKWSIYMKKMLANNHLAIILQFARDHMRFQHILDEPKVYEEALVRPNNWWWTTKVSWIF